MFQEYLQLYNWVLILIEFATFEMILYVVDLWLSEYNFVFYSWNDICKLLVGGI